MEASANVLAVSNAVEALHCDARKLLPSHCDQQTMRLCISSEKRFKQAAMSRQQLADPRSGGM